MASPRRSFLAPALLLCASVLSAPSAGADPVPSTERVNPTEALPKQLESVEVTEHLGGPVPKSLAFKDELGRPVTIGQYFDGKLPVVLTFNYSNCPMLCSLMLNGFVDGLKKLDYTPGKQFRVITVSIDHNEKPEHALRTQHRYLAQYERPEAKDGWHFLTGSEANVRAYAQALGFGYAYVPERKEYAHPSAIALASPEGRIVRYLYGIEYPKESLKLGLLEASEGRIGNPFDRLILYCFHYDSSIGRYAPVAANVMRVGGAMSVALLAGFLGLLFRADRKRRLREARPAEGVS
ncbi:MAG TPA: SCO family protein [Polyangiaceae bacterium]